MSDEAERLYERARTTPPEDRAAFVREACRGDAGLRDELLSLLEEAEAAEEFFGLLGDAVLSDSFFTGGPGASPESAGSAAAVRADREPASPELPPGHTVGHYRIVERVGVGGMGTIYRARDTRLARDVALKFLPPHLRTDDEAEDRLLNEARAAAALEHPNVCTVHEIGETEEGQPFIAMAFYEGETLKERLRRGALAPAEAARVAADLARALAAAHARGIIHRDVKPGNVMLTADGTVKLLDFGIAEMADVALRRPGAARGTVPYMSPEQIQGEPLDPRTDLWSLGVVLYEMLTGLRPFRGEDVCGLLQAILHDDPDPVTERRPEIPEPLARIVERLLRKDPDARYASANELRADLARFVAPVAGSTVTTGVGKRRGALAVAGIAAVAVALVAAPLWLPRSEDESTTADAVRASEPSIAVLPLADLSENGRDAALANGMSEELIGILAKARGLRVISRTSAFAFRDRELDVRSVADSLGVTHVLEGSLHRIGSRLRVQVRLVDGRDGSTRWSETYDREAKDVFAVQHEIARAVVRDLDLRLAGTGPDLLRHQTPQIAAYELYLRGSDPTVLRSDSGVRRAVGYFEQAIALDSTYAAAHAGLARMSFVLSSREDPGMPVSELWSRAERAALKAVALDDSLAEAHAALAIVKWGIAYDFAAAEAGLKRAIELDPTQSRFHQWLAQLYMQTGRPGEALSVARRALEIDPLSPEAHAELAHALLANGRYDDALTRLQRLEGLQPPLLRAAGYTAQAYAMKGMWEEAIAVLRPQVERRGRSAGLSFYGYLLARAGRRDEARRVQATLLDRWRSGKSGAFQVAVVYVGLGDLDRAFAWLDRSIDDRSLFHPKPPNIMEPIFEGLRSDPRFERIRERLGLESR